MYTTLLFAHSILRWLVLGSLLYTIYRSYTGYSTKRSFNEIDNATRQWTATIAHIQLVVGFTLYIKSPLVKYFWTSNAPLSSDISFFGAMHIFLMLLAIVLITIGSAKAKRKTIDKEKFSTLMTWFSIALLIIFLAIPWPFSPLANRPYIRIF